MKKNYFLSALAAASVLTLTFITAKRQAASPAPAPSADRPAPVPAFDGLGDPSLAAIRPPKAAVPPFGFEETLFSSPSSGAKIEAARSLAARGDAAAVHAIADVAEAALDDPQSASRQLALDLADALRTIRSDASRTALHEVAYGSRHHEIAGAAADALVDPASGSTRVVTTDLSNDQIAALNSMAQALIEAAPSQTFKKD